MIHLIELCLTIIAREFKRFYLAFTASNNEILKLNLEFLQRKYSSELGLELFESGEIKEEYLEFLMNVHLKFLDLEWLENSRYRKSMKDIFHRLPNLRGVSCSEINDEIFENVAKFCPKIVEIRASYSSVRDYGIKYLCRNENGKIPCPDLKILSIPSFEVTDKIVKYLIQNFPSLEIITYPYLPRILYSLHKDDFHNLEKLPAYNFVVLKFFGVSDLPYYTDLLKICLTVCPRLKTIRFYVTNTEQLNLFSNISLEDLDLSVCKTLQRNNISDFLKNNGSKLVSLKVSNCLMSIKVLCASCPKLEHLYMDDVTFVDDDYDSQSVFNCLTECIFRLIKDDTSNNKAMSLLLSSSPNLECLEFNWCYLSLTTGTRIFKCCENNNFLQYITLCFTTVEMRLLKDILLSSFSLKDLNLCDCDYSSNDLMELVELAKTLPNKPDISIDNVNINDCEQVITDEFY